MCCHRNRHDCDCCDCSDCAGHSHPHGNHGHCCHGEREHPHGFKRCFFTREERIAELEAYKSELLKEVRGIEERIEDLKKKNSAPAQHGCGCSGNEKPPHPHSEGEEHAHPHGDEECCHHDDDEHSHPHEDTECSHEEDHAQPHDKG